MPRTLTKGAPELGIAIAVIAIGFLIDEPEKAAVIGPGGVVLLQALRRALRDVQRGQPPE